MSDSFNWQGHPDIIIPEQPATAVYLNGRRQVVIRQEADWNEEEDRFVFISPEYALRVARAILAAAGINPIEVPHAPDEKPQGKSPGAIRQARFRDNKRNAPSVTGVTPRNVEELFALDAIAPLHEKEGTAG